MILMIGHSRVNGGEGFDCLSRRGYRIARLGELDASLLRDAEPELVISSLLGDGFDAIDVAIRLAGLGYTGPYRVLCPPLPKPEAVRDEIRAAAPGLDFDLLIVTHGPVQPV